MAQRRRLLLLGGAMAIWVGGFRFVPQIASRFGGFEFTPLDQVPGFRTIAGSVGSASTGGGGFDVTVGLSPADPLPAGLIERVRAAPEAALFGGAGGAEGATPVAYFFDYYCPYCRVLSDHLADLVATSEIRVARQHWPIFGEASVLAARASLAAEMQGDTEALHNRLMRTPGRATPRFVEQVAGDLGLSWPRLARDMQAPSVTAALEQARALAQLFRFIGTPSLVVGRTAVQGEIAPARLRDLARLERPAG